MFQQKVLNSRKEKANNSTRIAFGVTATNMFNRGNYFNKKFYKGNENVTTYVTTCLNNR